MRDTPEFLVAALPKLDALSLPAPLGDRTGSGQRLDAVGGGKAITMVTELDQRTRSQEVAGPGQRIEDESVRVLFEELSQSGFGFVPPAHLWKKEFG